MGTLLPVLGAITQTVTAFEALGGAIDTISGNNRGEGVLRAQQDQAMRDLQRQQAQQTSDAEADAKAARDKVALDAAESERQRLSALKRAVAKRNARFGAAGISGDTGSREAILLGLYNESDAEKQQREDLDKLRYAAIDSDLSSLNNRNILEQTQLAERQKLTRLAQGY